MSVLRRWWLPTVAVAAVLTPEFAPLSDFPALRAEQVLAAAGLLLFVIGPRLSARMGKRFTHPPTISLFPIEAALAMLAAVMLLSIVVASVLLDQPLSRRDLFEPAKLVLYVVVFRLSLALSRADMIRQRTLTVLLGAGACSALIGVVQYFNPGGLGVTTGRWWAHPQHLLALERDARAFGSVGNANYFGALMAVLFLVLLGDRAVERPPRLRAAVAALLALGLVVSGSRSALALLVVGGGTMTALAFASGRHVSEPKADRRRVGRRLLAGALLLTLAVILVQVFPRGRQHYLGRLSGAFASDSSLALRWERLRNAFSKASLTESSTGGQAAGPANLLRNGDLERGGALPADFRLLPGTSVERVAGAARHGDWGVVYRGNPAAAQQRAALYQQRALAGVTGTFTASLWLRFTGPVQGTVELYVNLILAGGSRYDPLVSTAANPTKVGEWQRLALVFDVPADQPVDFVGVYLLSDHFAGEVQADGFQLLSGNAPSDALDLPEAEIASGGAGDALRRSPLTGLGPGKSAAVTTLDNEYLTVLSRFGLLGLAAYLMVWLTFPLTRWPWRGVRPQPAPDAGGERASLTGIAAGMLVFNLAAGTLFHLQLMAILMVLCGLLHGASADSKPGTAI